MVRLHVENHQVCCLGLELFSPVQLIAHELGGVISAPSDFSFISLRSLSSPCLSRTTVLLTAHLRVSVSVKFMSLCPLSPQVLIRQGYPPLSLYCCVSSPDLVVSGCRPMRMIFLCAFQNSVLSHQLRVVPCILFISLISFPFTQY